MAACSIDAHVAATATINAAVNNNANQPLQSHTSFTPLGVTEPALAGAVLAVTGAGRHFRTIDSNPSANIGLVEIDEAGSAYRVIWGLVGGRPTSELASHVSIHAARMAATNNKSRVVYHAHTPALVALSSVRSFSSRSLTRLLWKSITESVIMIPGGIGLLPWMVPSTVELAHATRAAASEHAVFVWSQHGACATGASFEEAFGIMHTAEKAARICLDVYAARAGVLAEGALAEGALVKSAPEKDAQAEDAPTVARIADGVVDGVVDCVTDSNIREMATVLGLPLRFDYLE